MLSVWSAFENGEARSTTKLISKTNTGCVLYVEGRAMWLFHQVNICRGKRRTIWWRPIRRGFLIFLANILITERASVLFWTVAFTGTLRAKASASNIPSQLRNSQCVAKSGTKIMRLSRPWPTWSEIFDFKFEQYAKPECALESSHRSSWVPEVSSALKSELEHQESKWKGREVRKRRPRRRERAAFPALSILTHRRNSESSQNWPAFRQMRHSLKSTGGRRGGERHGLRLKCSFW